LADSINKIRTDLNAAIKAGQDATKQTQTATAAVATVAATLAALDVRLKKFEGSTTNPPPPPPTQPDYINLDRLGIQKLEDVGDFTIPAFRTGTLKDVITLKYATAPYGTNPASANDFVGGVFPSGTFTIDAGEVQETIHIPVNRDTAKELDETFQITLTLVSGNAQIQNATAIGTIQNDDTVVSPPDNPPTTDPVPTDPGNVPPPTGGQARPSVIPSDYDLRFNMNFRGMNAMSITSAQSDDGIASDPGLMSMGTARYRRTNDPKGAFSYPGIEGFGFDAALDPFHSAIPVEYLQLRPTGEVEIINDIGMRVWSRSSPVSQMDTLLKNYFASIRGSLDYGVPMRLAGYVSTYRKVAAAPPFARCTWFTPHDAGPQHCFAAAQWSTEDGNHGYDGKGGDTAVPALEIDDHEFLNNPAGSYDFNTGCPTITIAGGTWNIGDPRGKKIGLCSVFAATGINFYHSVNDGPWIQHATMSASNLTAARYNQLHTGWIQNCCGGHPWLGKAGAATTDMYIDIHEDQLYVPASNKNVIIPKFELLPAVKVNLVSGLKLKGAPVGTKVADLVFPSNVASASVITAGARLKVVGNQLQVATQLNPTTQPVLNFSIQGTNSGGSKSINANTSVAVV